VLSAIVIIILSIGSWVRRQHAGGMARLDKQNDCSVGVTLDSSVTWRGDLIGINAGKCELELRLKLKSIIISIINRDVKIFVQRWRASIKHFMREGMKK
jgi:hypothetical protein